MKAVHETFQGLVRYVLFAVILCMAPGVAHADQFDNFIGFYCQIEGYAKQAGVSLPFACQQVTDTKDLVKCLDQAGNNDVEIALCIDKFQDTSTGSSITQPPSWVWDLLDCYIYYRTGDWWSLGYKLGEAAVCIVLQVATGGADICTILEELAELANAISDTAEALAQFFASIGEAAWDAIQEVGCALGLGGCDDGPSTPPEAIVYSSVFATRLNKGLAAREAWDLGRQDNPSFDNLVTMLKQEAQQKIYSTPDAVNKAAKIFTYNVNIQWTNDIVMNVLPARAEKLKDYSTPQNLDHLAQLVLSKYVPGAYQYYYDRGPDFIITAQCSDDLKQQFIHVDRWLHYPTTELGPQAADIKPTVKSNNDLAGDFYEQVENDIYQRIRAHVVAQYCPDVGGRLVGNTIDKHRNCIALMRSFDKEDQCWANTTTCGREARDAIIARFKEEGTSFYSGPFSNPPVAILNYDPNYDPIDFICYRPTHVKYFKEYYTELYKDLPRKLLKSKLQMDENYARLKNKVAEAVEKLNSTNGVRYYVHVDDPLIVWANDVQALGEVENSTNNFGFGPPSAKPGFEFSQKAPDITIDGRTTPLMFFDVIGEMEKRMKKKMADRLGKPLAEALPKLDPSGPITNPVEQAEVPGRNIMKAPGRNIMKDPGRNIMKDPRRVQQNVSAVTVTPKEVAVGGATQPMSGTLPEGQTPKTGSGMMQTPPALKTAPLPPVFPDLTVEAQLKVNAIRTGWGKTVELIAEVSPITAEMEFTVKNSGPGDSAGFTVTCVTASKKLFQNTVAPLKSGETRRMKASVDLTIGEHLLVVTIDSAGAVTESNEANNRYEFRINVREKPKMNLQERMTPSPGIKPVAPVRNR